MQRKLVLQLLSIFLITTMLFSGFFICQTKSATANQQISLTNYLSYFYNRYSQHLDENGLIFQAPGYGVPEFRQAESAREIISLSLYYKYRALQGEKLAREKLRQAILDADKELNSRANYTQSFSDAFAQLAIISLLDQVPFLLKTGEQKQIYYNIVKRAKSGILAPDTSNRAALSACYWQYILDNLHNKKLISDETKLELDKLIYQKIKSVLETDVKDYWYSEGKDMKFNPHYHMIATFAFMAYGNLKGDFEFLLAAKKMTENLRAITFKNGMVEARIGQRPVGLGAQFYLGAGLLNYKFNYSDFATYFNYAKADRFFSDADYPNRLEYHSTVKNIAPILHDDISFSNLAELALLIPSFARLKFQYTSQMKNIPSQTKQGEIKVTNQNNVIEFQDEANYLKIKLDESGNYTLWLAGDLPVFVLGDTTIDKYYDRSKMLPQTEQDHLKAFKKYLKENFGLDVSSIPVKNLQKLFNAYLYGSYTLEEIIDTLKNGPRAVHPSIPATAWRRSMNYQGYLRQLTNK